MLTRESGRTANRRYIGYRRAHTGPDLRLTAIHSSGVLFNGRHLRDPCNYLFTELSWLKLVLCDTCFCLL